MKTALAIVSALVIGGIIVLTFIVMRQPAETYCTVCGDNASNSCVDLEKGKVYSYEKDRCTSSTKFWHQ